MANTFYLSQPLVLFYQTVLTDIAIATSTMPVVVCTLRMKLFGSPEMKQTNTRMQVDIYQCPKRHMHIVLQGQAQGTAAFEDSETFAKFVAICQEFMKRRTPIPQAFLNAFGDRLQCTYPEGSEPVRKALTKELISALVSIVKSVPKYRIRHFHTSSH